MRAVQVVLIALDVGRDFASHVFILWLYCGQSSKTHTSTSRSVSMSLRAVLVSSSMVGVVCCKQVSSYNSVDLESASKHLTPCFLVYVRVVANSECHFLASERI